MIYFKDVITEITSMILEALKFKQNPMLCPVCGKGILKKNSELEHMIEVAAGKGASCSGAGAISAPAYGSGTPLGSAVPAPDYWFMCPNPKCHRVFIMVDDIISGGKRFVNINIFDRIFSRGGNKKDSSKRGGGSSIQAAPEPQEEEENEEEYNA